MQSNICKHYDCDCTRFIPSWSPTVCAMCRHPHNIATRPNNSNRGQTPIQGNSYGRGLPSSVSQQPFSVRRPSLSRQNSIPNKNVNNQQSIIQQRRTLPSTPSNQNSINNRSVSPRNISPQTQINLTTINMSNPKVIQFLNSLDQALKNIRKRGLTKREADKIVNGGLLIINNNGNISINPNLLQKMSNTPQNTQQQTNIQSNKPPLQPLKNEHKTTPNINPSSTTHRQSISSNTPIINSPNTSSRLRAEIMKLREALEKEKAARKAAEFRNESKTGLFTSDRRNEILQQRIKELETRINEKDSFIIQLKNRCQTQDDTIHDLQSRKFDSKSIQEKFESQIQKREKELAELREKLSQEHTLCIQYETKNEGLIRNLKEYQVKIDLLENEKTLYNKQLQEEQEKYNKKLYQIKEFSEKQLQDMKKRLQEEELKKIAAQNECEERKSFSLSRDDNKIPKLESQITLLKDDKKIQEQQIKTLTQDIKGLQCQLNESEKSREEIATHILNIQLQFADTLEKYEKRIINDRHKKEDNFSQIDGINMLIQQFQGIIKPLESQKIRLDKNKDKKLIIEINKIIKALKDNINKLGKSIVILETASRQCDNHGQAFLKSLENSRAQIQSTTEIRNKEKLKILKVELETLKKQRDVEIEYFTEHIQREVKLREDLENQLNSNNNNNNSNLLDLSSNNDSITSSQLTEFHQRLEDEVKLRQKYEEENQQLLLKVNTLELSGNDISNIENKYIKEKNELQDQINVLKNNYEESLNELHNKLELSEKNLSMLTNTKSALESTIDMLMLQNAALSENKDNNTEISIDYLIQQERQRSKDKINILQNQINELQQKLSEAEKQAVSIASGDAWVQELDNVKKVMENALFEAHQENAHLSAQLEAANAKIQSLDFDEDDFDLPIPPDDPPPPPPNNIPPPPPPNNIPPPPIIKSPSSNTSNLFADIQNSDKTKLKSLKDIPKEVVAPERADLMSQIRNGSSVLRPVSRRDTNKTQEPNYDDPQNMLQVLARVLLTRREGIEDDREEDSEDESWDA